MSTQTTKIRNGKISFSLPQKLQRAWRGAEVFVLPTEDSLILKRISKPLSRLSDLASRISSPKMSQKEINKEIQSYRRSKK